MLRAVREKKSQGNKDAEQLHRVRRREQKCLDNKGEEQVLRVRRREKNS